MESPTNCDRTIWVHVGTHKTGTTSIQAFLTANRELLRSHGLYVPKAGTIHAGSGHHNLAWQLLDDPRFAPAHGALGDLVTELAMVAERRAVISSEAFEYCVERPEGLARLERGLRGAGWEPHYLVLFRPQADYAVSLHAELRRHRVEASFPHFVVEVLRRAKFVTKGTWCFYFDYELFLDAWRRATSGTLHARRYTKSGTGGSVIADVLAAIGTPVAAMASCIDQAELLNAGAARSRGPTGWLAGMLIDARFAPANARLRQRFGVDLR